MTEPSRIEEVQAELLAEGVSTSSHRSVRRLFGLHLIKQKKLEVRFPKIIAEEQDDRFLADYDAWFRPEQERVEKRVNEVGEFLAGIHAYLAGKT